MDSGTIANIDNSIEKLDSEIAKIRQEINNFQNRRRLLSASLLSSDYVRQRIEQSNSQRDGVVASTSTATVARSVREEVSSLLSNAHKHRETNLHRLAFATTSFPWKDPNPYSDCPNLLGIRIDVSERGGTFAKPYYVLLRREKEDNTTPTSSSSVQRQRRSMALFSIYRHTIPAFIPIEKLAQRYLPQARSIRKRGEADDEIEMLKAKAKTRKQDLSTFVRQLRKEIAAWHVRRDSISWLQERTGVTSENHDGDEGVSEQEETERQQNDHATLLVSLAATSLECRYVRLEWRDGRVGRFKISNAGLVERAVVIGDKGRDKRTETILMGGDRRVETLVGRLLST
ncbi:hypothetical protein UA08_01868 [Talaromyces atroroseus]|uniref:Cenp-O kinetochore centromere component n=1 Tax=Talaromyces atroroseus TaxID=1441469 RepID=A0A1Q5QBU1_TALAT|nr:hypothetical protein UA08_01868 [Talaromyces atroroseus]OKL63288.1 hypothetical protein UA08_01868 [Talaromyces atroroseus]